MKKHTKNGHGLSRRGRPLKPETTDLIAALIMRQLAMSRRTATKINRILDSHLRCGDAARSWARLVRDCRAALSTLPGRIRLARPTLSENDVAVLRELIAEALEEMVVTDEDRALAARPPLPPEPRAAIEPVASLARARAQTARLQSRLLDLRERIVPPHRRAS